MTEAKAILKDIRDKKYKPVYVLHGEESYFIDTISDYIQNNVLEAHEKDFNQTIMYGKETDAGQIMAAAKRFPMMAERQVVIVKEAQNLTRELDKLESYFSNPMESTVLVICYKYKKIDKRKKIAKLAAKAGVLFESKKLYENQVGSWIEGVLKSKGYNIEPKATFMLVEFLGTDLAKINNELQKLQLVLPKGTTISAKEIEENIGISKDFNVFELNKALGQKNAKKCFTICNYFSANPKQHPIIPIIALLYNYFSKVLLYHGLASKSEDAVAKALKVNRFFVKDYVQAAQYYPMRKVSGIISSIKDADLKVKGVGASPFAQQDILKSLLVEILN